MKKLFAVAFALVPFAAFAHHSAARKIAGSNRLGRLGLPVSRFPLPASLLPLSLAFVCALVAAQPQK